MQTTYGVDAGIRTWATLVGGGQCSHQCAILMLLQSEWMSKTVATTTEAVKKDLPPLCNATERFEKPLNFLAITKEHIILTSYQKLRGSLSKNRPLNLA